ncbi:SPFH domain-containing protein [bacterium]|nr:SPFH domain-containing protein [bacterium]
MVTEKVKVQHNGGAVFFLFIILLLCSVAGIVFIRNTGLTVFLSLFIGFMLFMLIGFFTIEPNEAAVLLLFGKYKGTEKEMGLRWTNPLYKRKKLSLRARNFDGERLKVNDKKGNPIEISAVVVWRVSDTAKAVFDVESFTNYVEIQALSALRHLATTYPYDTTEEDTESLRSSIDAVSEALKIEIQERTIAAGVEIMEARINHLSYAPEIAQAMLRRQQAEAIIEARQKIVDGAVGMVQMALERLREQNVLELDEERKANMVSNLMVVLCSEEATQPIINTGSLY